MTNAALIVSFSDPRKISESGQLFYLAGWLLGPSQLNSISHIICWSSHKARWPAKSFIAAETLSAGEPNDIDNGLVITFERLLEKCLNLIIVDDSNDFLQHCLHKNNLLTNPIRGDISVIQFEFRPKTVSRIVLVPGKLNVVDIVAKFERPLKDAVLHLLQSSTLPFAIKLCE